MTQSQQKNKQENTLRRRDLIHSGYHCGAQVPCTRASVCPCVRAQCSVLDEETARTAASLGSKNTLQPSSSAMDSNLLAHSQLDRREDETTARLSVQLQSFHSNQILSSVEGTHTHTLYMPLCMCVYIHTHANIHRNGSIHPYICIDRLIDRKRKRD